MDTNLNNKLVESLDLIYRCLHDDAITHRATRLDHAHDMLIKKFRGDSAAIEEAWDMAAALNFVTYAEAGKFTSLQPVPGDSPLRSLNDHGDGVASSEAE